MTSLLQTSGTRETRLWIAAVVLVVCTYSTLYVARFATEWLRERNLLYVALGVVFLSVVGGALFFVLRARPGIREWLVLAGVAAVYGVLFRFLRTAEEAMHFVQYGLVGALIYAALLERRERLGPGGILRRVPAVSAVVLTLGLGWLDEGIQYVLPNRYYDLRDVAFNAAAGVLAVSAMAGRQWARSSDGIRSDDDLQGLR